VKEHENVVESFLTAAPVEDGMVILETTESEHKIRKSKKVEETKV